VSKLDHLYLYDPATGARLDISPRSLNGGTVALHEDGLDLGFPAIRENVEDRPGQSGQYDYTSLYSARTITMSLKILETDTAPAAVTRRQLRAWLAPSKSPQLVWQFVNDVEMYADLTASDLSNTLNKRAFITGTTDAVLSYKVASGRFLSTTVQDIFIPYSGVSTGRTYPLTYPRTYPAATGVNTANVLNSGTENTYPIVRLFGPMSSPKIANETTGLYLEFAGLTINAGDYIEINLAERTVQLNGQAGANSNRRGSMTTRQWWYLAPGYNSLRYSGSGSIGAQGELLAQDAYL
jgi:phage-related protein